METTINFRNKIKNYIEHADERILKIFNTIIKEEINAILDSPISSVNETKFKIHIRNVVLIRRKAAPITCQVLAAP